MIATMVMRISSSIMISSPTLRVSTKHGFPPCRTWCLEDYEGTIYRSLSAVAKAITGSHCSGYRFFRLLPQGVAS
jgi:hypothetical protein